MNRSRSVSTPAGLTEEILVVAWSVFANLPEAHPLRAEFITALWTLEDAIDTSEPVDAALVAVVRYVGTVSA